MLRSLRIEHARALLAATDDDAANLATALRARAMRPDLRIAVRLFDPDLAARLETAFGGFESRSIHALAAPAFAAAAVGRQVLATIPVGTDRTLIVARVPIEEDAPADGSTVSVEEGQASSVELGGCRVLAIVDGDTVRWKPAAEERSPGGPGAAHRGHATGTGHDRPPRPGGTCSGPPSGPPDGAHRTAGSMPASLGRPGAAPRPLTDRRPPGADPV